MDGYARWFHFLEQQRTLTGETREQILFRLWVSSFDKAELTAKFETQFAGETTTSDEGE